MNYCQIGSKRDWWMNGKSAESSHAVVETHYVSTEAVFSPIYRRQTVKVIISRIPVMVRYIWRAAKGRWRSLFTTEAWSQSQSSCNYSGDFRSFRIAWHIHRIVTASVTFRVFRLRVVTYWTRKWSHLSSYLAADKCTFSLPGNCKSLPLPDLSFSLDTPFKKQIPRL